MSAATPATASSEGLNEWLSLLASHQPSELQFVETRGSSLLSEPLTVSGQLRRDGERLIRQATSPRAETHVLTERHVEIHRDGGSRRRFALRRAPELAALREVLLAVLDGDGDRLAEHFLIDWTVAEDEDWSLSLTPRDVELAERVEGLELTGSAQSIDALSLALSDGEVISTRFLPQP